MKIKALVLLSVFIVCSIMAAAQSTYRCRVVDKATDEPLVGAVVRWTADKSKTTVTDSNGYFTLSVPVKGSSVLITYVGYRPLQTVLTTGALYRLAPSATNLDNVVVTATESKGLTSSSKIARHAMEHLQPSSFADLLELLPGGRAQDPSLSTPNIIHIREIPISGSDYNTSALGTSFVIDGAPMSTNANLQYMAGAWDTQATSRDFTNAGVDMRSISTDDIDNVEIVRGIPSVEYGDLTSGLVKINRRRGGNDITARFKADMDSKLFYVAKSLEWKPRRLSLNLSADYLDSQADPRNLLETYKRLTLSARLNKAWTLGEKNLATTVNIDYGGSFDDDKVDPELNYGGVDKYSSSFNRYAVNMSATLTNRNKRTWWKSVTALAALSYEHNLTSRTRLVQLSRETPAATSTHEGESDAVLISPYTYTATHKVDGKPFSAFAKINAVWMFPLGRLTNHTKAGIDWQMDKNYGGGQLFNPLNPLYPGISSRQRRYSAIPAEHIAAGYVEEKLSIKAGQNVLQMDGGVRLSSMLHLNSNYRMHGRVYADPRVNIGWTLPPLRIGRERLVLMLSGGYGRQTKFPTMDLLYPDLQYMDLVEMNYYHPNKAYRRIYLQTYIVNPVNYNLGPARNDKTEVRAFLTFAGNSLSVTLFREDMQSGFRYMSVYNPYTYKTYDTSGINGSTITSPPDPSTLPYTKQKELRAYGRTENGSRTLKKGVEYVLSTARVPVINTRLTITGAYFKTQYTNSLMVMEKPSVTIAGQAYKYVGIYKDDDGYIREMCNTNFTFDTDLPRLKLGFSISAQCLWMTASGFTPKDGMPAEWMDDQGNIHPYTAEDAKDAYLQQLVRTGLLVRDRQTVPFSMNLNIKATKKLLGDRMMLALFVNKLLDSHSDYVRNGYTYRRHVTPYFGLEMNVKL